VKKQQRQQQPQPPPAPPKKQQQEKTKCSTLIYFAQPKKKSHKHRHTSCYFSHFTIIAYPMLLPWVFHTKCLALAVPPMRR